MHVTLVGRTARRFQKPTGSFALFRSDVAARLTNQRCQVKENYYYYVQTGFFLTLHRCRLHQYHLSVARSSSFQLVPFSLAVSILLCTARSNIMDKHTRLRESGEMLAGRGDLRGACDKFLAATLAAPSVWSPHRFKCFMMHTMILRELHFKASESDIKTLRKKFLRNVNEPPHFRVQASFALGVLETNRGDRETAAEMYREGLIIAREASPEEKAKTVQSDDGPVPVALLIETDSKIIESNLSILSGTGPTMEKHPCEYKRDFGKKDAMPPIGDTIALTSGVLEHSSFSEENVELLARLMERATMV